MTCGFASPRTVGASSSSGNIFATYFELVTAGGGPPQRHRGPRRAAGSAHHRTGTSWPSATRATAISATPLVDLRRLVGVLYSTGHALTMNANKAVSGTSRPRPSAPSP